MNVVTKAIEDFGGVTKLAAALGEISYQAVRKWEVSGVPPRRVLLFEKVTGLPRHKIRPDIYPPEESA